MSAASVADAPERERFEISLDGEPAHEGEGLASRLIAAALEAARAEGLAVLPFCPFVRDFIEAHKEYLDLVPAGRRAEFKLD